jgi:Planctomycete cytochrome C
MPNYLKAFIFVLIFLGLVYLSLTCKNDVTGGDANSIVFPDSNVSYIKHVEPLFLATCAIPGGCHAGDEAAGGLSLESYEDLSKRIYIEYIPGDPDKSRLVMSIEGTAPGVPQMPYGRPPLNANQRKGIRTWIKEGAKFN